MDGVLLIIVLVITGGCIAFIGDRLGSKIGKKRLSLFGLRPRHTSILVTILTGVTITTLTFGVLSVASENVRTALFGMKKLNQKITDTQNQLNDANRDLESAKQQQADTEAQLVDLRNRAKDLLEGNKQLENANRELLNSNNSLMADNQRLDAMNFELEGSNNQLKSDNSKLTGDNAALQTDKKMLTEQSERLRQGIQLMREGDIVFKAGEVLAVGVIKGGTDPKTIKEQFDGLMQAANRSVEGRLGDTVKDKNIWIYQPEYDKAADFISKSAHDYVVRIVVAGNLVRGEAVTTSLQLYQNSTIYKDNEFILARPFKLHGSEEEAEQAMMAFLQDINEAATSKGILPDPIRGSVGIIEGNQIYDIINQLRPITGTALLTAYAKGDTDALGPLRIYIRVDTQ